MSENPESPFPTLNDPLADLKIDSWEKIQLSQLCEINPDSISTEKPEDWKIEYIDISSVDEFGTISDKKHMEFGDAPSRARRGVIDDDVIVSTVRTYLRAISRIEKPYDNTVVSTGFAVLRPGKLINSKFLLRVLQASPYINWIVANSEGVSYPAIASERLGDLVITLPNRKKQHRIVNYIDKGTDNILESIQEMENLMELLSELRRSEIQKATTEGIQLNSLMKEPGERWFKKIPAHWEIRRLDHLRKERTPIVYGIIKPGPDQEEGIPYIKGGDCKPEMLSPEKLAKTSPEIASNYIRSKLNAGDLVYEIRGSVGRVVKVPEELEGANLTQDTARISPKDELKTDWLLYALRSESFRQQMDLHTGGATVEGVNLFDLRRGLIPVPPRHEQEEIAEYLKGLDAILDEIHEELERGIELLKEKRQALITAAVTGKIDFSEQQESDPEITA